MNNTPDKKTNGFSESMNELLDISLEELETEDDTVLSAALRRYIREGASEPGVTNHTNTSHTNSHSNNPW